MDRVLKSTRPALTTELRDKQGNLLDADTGTQVTFQAYDSAGIVVGAQIVAARASLGTYEVTPAAAVTATLDLYRATWTATLGGAAVSFEYLFEVVGGFLFSLAELRAFDPDLASTTNFPPDKLVVARESAEETIENLCGVAFRPRGRRSTLDGNGSATLLLPDLYPTKLISASIDAGSGAAAMSAADLADIALYSWGTVVRKSRGIWTGGASNVTVFYEYGLAEPPEPVRRAAMMLARSILVESFPPERAVSFQTQEGSYRLATAGRDGPTGIPEVDSVIDQFSQRVPAVG